MGVNIFFQKKAKLRGEGGGGGVLREVWPKAKILLIFFWYPPLRHVFSGLAVKCYAEGELARDCPNPEDICYTKREPNK